MLGIMSALDGRIITWHNDNELMILSPVHYCALPILCIAYDQRNSLDGIRLFSVFYMILTSYSYELLFGKTIFVRV